jgi:3-oxoacyl-[acyl-carrier-protein] synthase II
VLSASGIGLAPIAEALQGTPPLAAPNGPDWPAIDVRSVAGFDPESLLGKKGLGRTTRTDQLGAAACKLAAQDAADGPAAEQTGIVLGTSIGSAAGILDFLHDTFEQDRPYLVNPSHFPGTLMNSAAGKAAIRQDLTGPNATVSGGPLAALHALRYARTTLLAGHARRLLAGGVEELSPETAWAWQRSGALARGVALSEGSAVFALDASDGTGTPLGRLAGSDIGFADLSAGPAVVAARLAETIDAALSRAGTAAVDVTTVVPGTGGRRGWAAVEERALRDALPSRQRLAVHPVLGETHGAGTALHLAAMLAQWQAGRIDRVAVLTSIGFDGSVGCLVATHPDFT